MKLDIIGFLKRWTLPSAIVIGATGYLVFGCIPALDPVGEVLGDVFDVLFPFSVFLTLFVTFSKVNFHKMRPRRWHATLLLLQLLLVAACVAAIIGFHIEGEQKLIWEAVLTCLIAPCASAAPVVTGKLGGDINGMTTYTLIASVACAVTIPLVFPVLEPTAGVSFLTASLIILHKLAVVMLLPLFLGWVVRHYVPPVYQYIMRHPDLGFYCWGLSLAIVTGITVKNIIHSPASGQVLLLIAVLSFAVCIFHFIVGRAAGRLFHERINCGQGMFQKNTSMAIWVAYLYLNPVASIGAGCYVLWQNIVNSYEIWEHERIKN